MEALLFVGALIGLSILAFVPETIEDHLMLKKAHTVFVKGNTLKFYKKKSNVFDTYECTNTYTILGTKGDYVCLKDVETGEENEKYISLICKYSVRCEVLAGDKIVALFQGMEQKFYEFKPEEINPNCN